MVSSVILAENLEISGCSTLRPVHVAVLALDDGLWNRPDMALQSSLIAAESSQ
jgi:hypothetical protein